jgi:hypothetical protein
MTTDPHKWYNATMSHPADQASYLVVVDRRHQYAIAWYDDVRHCWCRPGSRWKVRRVRYWMDLPEIPYPAAKEDTI